MREMTGLERCRAMMDGETPDRIPVVPQAFLVAASTLGMKIGEINNNPALLAKSHMLCQEKYGYDGCVIDIDDASLAEACGAKVIYRKDEVASVDEHDPVMKSIKDLDKLKLPDPGNSRLSVWLETTERLVDAIGNDVLVMGRADQGPFSLACLLRGTANFMMDLMTADPADVKALLAWCTEACITFAKAQKDAGAHVTSMGDSSAGPNLISPDMYREFAVENERRVVAELQEYGIPYSLHICGDSNLILESMATTRADIYEVDWKVDMKAARKVFGSDAVLMGNVDPSAGFVLGKPEDIMKASKKIIEDTKGRGLFLSSGCALGYNTKEENLKALVEAACKFGSLEKVLAMK